ncbi:MAG TPA: VWA domain-containing protein, partial [Pyrinomonadaceae bacterium]|nr:VWA domain-containing protein [Pyrinomonadaceae bacterium]
KRLCLALLTLTVIPAGQLAFAQQPQKPTTDDVLRVNTELVQTAITVIDKQGHFVDGLNRDQFELMVDGKPRPISFFERVTAGSPREEQLTTAPDPSVAPPQTSRASTALGRSIIFFIDDMHMSAESLHRTRDMMRHFLDTEMTTKDSVAITSASGQIGFLQQFTGQKEVLSAAIERLNPVPYNVIGFGTGSTVMTEYLALDIDGRKSDEKVLNFYIEECMKQANTNMAPPALIRALRATCTTDVKNSARAVLMQAGKITENMYASLESLLKSSARAPGRKLVFMISDGFLMDVGEHGPGLRDRLDHIIDSARRSGSVIYTIHAQGLVTNFPDVSNKTPTDPNGRLDMAKVGEVAASQDALHALADETGGRALRNTNYFERWVGQVLDETSNYYLVAWRPEADAEKLAKFRAVTIRIANRPELTVRAPRGYVEGPTTAAIASAGSGKAPANHAVRTAESELRDALSDYFPSRGLPAALSLTFLNTPKNEMLLTSSIQVATNALDYGSENKPATLKLAGVILSDKGKIAGSFKNQLNVNPIDGPSNAGAVIYNDRTALAPGIYQVRVAARDERNGHVGSAMQWVVIPNLATHQLMTSSVLLGGQVLESKTAAAATAQVQLSVDHRFPRQSRLGYWIFTYNAKRDSTGKPNLIIESQVIQDGRIVFSSQPRTIIDPAPDPDRIAFGDQLLLNSLSPGRYDLVVRVKDALAGTSTTQTVDFEVR